MSDEKTLMEISANLGKVVNLLGLQLTRDLSQGASIKLLSSAGLSPKEIAELLGTTANTVRVELSKARKRGRSAKVTKKS